ncbi:hypothetical protein VMCG_09995 [Cytospora schulzeri]|uniref:D-serine dehydratase-like domain-containing protein n=1 Tax=Cytospora schulzeri TaxID=448051 RepID=A0A423VIU7_9PEZI|nr:hypothetical protein VMCG_09995 [Valsa malicola]
MSCTKHISFSQTELDRIKSYLGKYLRDPAIPTPAAVLDLAVARRNCERMLDACKNLDIGLRGEVKSHKSSSLASLQCGEAGPLRFTFSTFPVAQELGSIIRTAIANGRDVDVMYGLPVGQCDIKRLAPMASWAHQAWKSKPGKAGPPAISVLIDDPDQLQHVQSFKDLSEGLLPNVHIKLNVDSDGAGSLHDSDRFKQLADAALEAQTRGEIVLAGLYAHTSDAMYKAKGSREENLCEAMYLLAKQFSFLQMAADAIVRSAETKAVTPIHTPLVLSASVRCAEVLEALHDYGKHGKDNNSLLENEAANLLYKLKTIRDSGFMTPEIHSGSHAMLDLQQLAVSQGLSTWTPNLWGNLALTVLAEVKPMQPGQEKYDDFPEVLINAGALALGEERCEKYPGLGMVTPWGRESSGNAQRPDSERKQDMKMKDHEGWIVGKVNQEHGVLKWQSGEKKSGSYNQEPDQLKMGQRVRIWPNSSSITSNHFDFYLVIDSDRKGKEDQIIEIWGCGRGC